METKLVKINIHKTVKFREDDHIYMDDGCRQHLTSFFAKWLDKNCKAGVYEILALLHNGDLTVLFESPEDAVQFKLIWG
jgi:hypothetical protein